MPEKNTVFLFDVDNTLLDHDRVTSDLRIHLESRMGAERAAHYWTLFEQIRNDLGYADYLGALQRYRLEYPHDPHLIAVSFFLQRYPFANRLYPNSIDVVEKAKKFGTAVILTDGDVVFQPSKIWSAGLYERFEGNVLIYIHKEQELRDVEEEYPAAHYVVIDDKVRILSAIKSIWGKRVTTVFVRQGHYALDAQVVAQYPPADHMLGSIGEMMNVDWEALSA